MKNVLVGLLFTGLTSLSYAQGPNFSSEVSAPGGVSTALFNTDYLKKVQDKVVPTHVLWLEQAASQWDVVNQARFDGRKSPFRATFKSKGDYVIATFDHQGSILTTEERYRNVALPAQFRNVILKENTGWSIVKTTYTVLYSKDLGAKKVYKVKIGKGNARKTVRINA